MYHTKGAYKGKKGSNKETGTIGSGGGGGEASAGGGVSGVPGLPAGFDDMTPEMQAKITAALEKKKAAAAEAATTAAAAEAEAEAAANAVAAPEDDYVQPRPIVEEFMSITDGQVMIESFSPEVGWGVSVKDSVSRIGSPGAAGPLKSLDMMQLRLDVMQADDMVGGGGASLAVHSCEDPLF